MKIMYPDNYASSILPSTENPNFPVQHLEDDYVGNLWKAAGNVATLIVDCLAGADCLAIFNTNATAVNVQISGWDSIDWEIDSGRAIDFAVDATRAIAWGAFGQTVSETLYDISASAIGNLWAEYSVTGNLAHTLIITLTGDSTIQAGILRSGIARSFRDPEPGIREGLRDYSIRRELNSGGFYTRKRPAAREFSFRLAEDRDTDFYRFIYDYAQLIGPAPVPWRIVSEGLTNWEWVLFASFDNGLPRGVHELPAHSFIDIDLIESI